MSLMKSTNRNDATDAKIKDRPYGNVGEILIPLSKINRTISAALCLNLLLSLDARER
jgi:hypothetical protein